MDKRLKGILAAGLVIGAVAISFSLAWRSPKIDLEPYAVLGAVTAEETAKLLDHKGTVLVMVRETGADRNPSVDAELQAFQRAMKSHRGLAVTIQRVALTPMSMLAAGGGVPPDQLFKALEAQPNFAGLVLFLGFPQLAEPELDRLLKIGTKIVVVSAPLPGYRRLLERQVIRLAVIPRPDAPSLEAPAPRTLRERFDQQFALITPTEAARLP